MTELMKLQLLHEWMKFGETLIDYWYVVASIGVILAIIGCICLYVFRAQPRSSSATVKDLQDQLIYADPEMPVWIEVTVGDDIHYHSASSPYMLWSAGELDETCFPSDSSRWRKHRDAVVVIRAVD